MPYNKEKIDRERRLNKVKKTVKRGRDDRPPRQKQWETDFDDEAGFERIMPRDEAERRKQVETLASRLPTPPESVETVHEPEALSGLVIEVGAGMCRVVVGEGEVWPCSLRGTLTEQETGYTNVVTVGDSARVLSNGAGGGVVIEIEPRRNVLARPDSFYTHLQQALAANIHQLLIVAAWRNPHYWPELIDRYLITAQRQNIPAILCINKVDLVEDVLDLEDYVKYYRKLGVTVLLTSTVSGAGLESLRTLIAGKITVLTGMSGVGKSSLLSAVEPTFQLRTGEVSDASGEGKHTTTQSVMLPIGAGGYVIDTPGIREFGLRGLDPTELASYYPEFEPYRGMCRFRGCTHRHEPDCGVRAAVEALQIPGWRYHTYATIYESL